MEDHVPWQGEVLEEQENVNQDPYTDVEVDFFNDLVSFDETPGSVHLDVPLAEGE